MSVRGEFHRLVRDCVGYLAEHAPEPSRAWRDRLESAAGLAEDDVCAAAREALVCLGAPGGRPHLALREQQARFEELAAHLAAICRVILGLPAVDPDETSQGDEP